MIGLSSRNAKYKYDEKTIENQQHIWIFNSNGRTSHTSIKIHLLNHLSHWLNFVTMVLNLKKATMFISWWFFVCFVTNHVHSAREGNVFTRVWFCLRKGGGKVHPAQVLFGEGDASYPGPVQGGGRGRVHSVQVQSRGRVCPLV